MRDAISQYLADAGYESIEAWARDSDYKRCPHCGDWFDENGNRADLDENLTDAIS